MVLHWAICYFKRNHILFFKNPPQHQSLFSRSMWSSVVSEHQYAECDSSVTPVWLQCDSSAPSRAVAFGVGGKYFPLVNWFLFNSCGGHPTAPPIIRRQGSSSHWTPWITTRPPPPSRRPPSPSCWFQSPSRGNKIKKATREVRLSEGRRSRSLMEITWAAISLWCVWLASSERTVHVRAEQEEGSSPGSRYS